MKFLPLKRGDQGPFSNILTSRTSERHQICCSLSNPRRLLERDPAFTSSAGKGLCLLGFGLEDCFGIYFWCSRSKPFLLQDLQDHITVGRSLGAKIPGCNLFGFRCRFLGVSFMFFHFGMPLSRSSTLFGGLALFFFHSNVFGFHCATLPRCFVQRMQRLGHFRNNTSFQVRNE